MNARDLWQRLEPIHAVVYFAPEAKQLYADAGLKGGWMGYFASRAAALGPVSAEVVTALFYNFHPAMVRRAIPDAWTLSTPARVLHARAALADAALRRMIDVDAPAVAEAAVIAREATAQAHLAGRPLFAAHASLPWPDQAHMRLWHAATLLREHRGDGHVAALTVEQVDGCEANVLMAAAGRVDALAQRSFRGWSDEDWQAAEERLGARGFLHGSALTREGVALRERIEGRTDALAAPVYEGVDVGRLADLLDRIDEQIAAANAIPYPNPMGLPGR